MMAVHGSTDGSGRGVGQISVLLPPVLAQVAGEQRKLAVPSASGATVGDVLDLIAADYPILGRRVRDETGRVRRFVNLFVDGEDIRGLSGTTTPVEAGQEVLIVQSVAGG